MLTIEQQPKKRFPEFDYQLKLYDFENLYEFKTTNSFSRDLLNYESGVVKNIHYGDIHKKFSALFDMTNEEVPYINADVNLSKIKDEQFLSNGDLVIADASEDYKDIGKTIEIISLGDKKVIAGLHTFLARRTTDLNVIGYMTYLLQTWFVRKQIMRIAQGTKVLSLSTSRLAKTKLILPEIQEQQKISGFFSAIDKKIRLLKEKHTLLDQYKKGVLQKLFLQKSRFKDDNGNDFPNWKTERIDYFVERASEPVDVQSDKVYREIGVRSHGKGIFHKKEIKGHELGSKRVFWLHPDAFVVNIVFAWEHAVAKTSDRESGFIASHRFPMFIPRENRVELRFFNNLFIRSSISWRCGAKQNIGSE
jgi:type I restriction enzyme S subunit